MVPPRPPTPVKSTLPKGAGEVRIIAGRLRGSKLPVLDSPGLRPSSDRVRETLFNWLQHQLAGAVVLDLFAGSGALGIEAASRGAAEVWLVEREPRLAQHLQQQVQRLHIGDRVHVLCADALAATLPAQLPAADLVLLDPPFAAQLWMPAIASAQRLLRPQAWVYLESARDAEVAIPPDWRLHREGSTREVRYALYQRQPVPA